MKALLFTEILLRNACETQAGKGETKMAFLFLVIGWMFVLFLVALALAYASAIVAEVYDCFKNKKVDARCKE